MADGGRAPAGGAPIKAAAAPSTPCCSIRAFRRPAHGLLPLHPASQHSPARPRPFAPLQQRHAATTGRGPAGRRGPARARARRGRGAARRRRCCQHRGARAAPRRAARPPRRRGAHPYRPAAAPGELMAAPGGARGAAVTGAPQRRGVRRERAAQRRCPLLFFRARPGAPQRRQRRVLCGMSSPAPRRGARRALLARPRTPAAPAPPRARRRSRTSATSNR
jgi:hypothetical protein